MGVSAVPQGLKKSHNPNQTYSLDRTTKCPSDSRSSSSFLSTAISTPECSRTSSSGCRSPSTRSPERLSNTLPETPSCQPKPVWKHNYNLLPCQNTPAKHKSETDVLLPATRGPSSVTLNSTELRSETWPEPTKFQVFRRPPGKCI